MGAATEPTVDSIAIGSKPHAAIAGLRDSRDHSVSNRGQGGEVATAENVEATGLSADPEVSFSVFEQREDAVTAELGLKLRRRDSVVETVEAFAGADPKCAARGGKEGLNAGFIQRACIDCA